ncbi:MAG: hypothetical protein JRF33_14635 [Deltaproteobacteria bacterium]|nr:hypothetical protein [Deltaproteobacteria bacterium]
MTTKTNTPKSHDFMNNLPFTFDGFKQLVDEQLGSIEKYGTEMARYEKQGQEQFTSAIDELGRLMKDSLEYSARLSSEWRKTAVDAGKRTTELLQSLNN